MMNIFQMKTINMLSKFGILSILLLLADVFENFSISE